jgi:hypothetical protein
MRRQWIMIGIVVAALLVGVLAPVSAQDGLDEQQQAALDEIRAALDHFINADTYTATISQRLTQTTGLTYLGQSVTTDWQVDANGEVQVQKMPDNQYDNRHATLSQIVNVAVSGGGQDDRASVGIEFEMIVVDDSIYLNVNMPGDLQARVPQGWQDITNGADMYPGMGAFNIDQMVKLGGGFGSDYVDMLTGAVTNVETLGQETVGGRVATRYRLTLDPVKALEGIGASNLEAMFNPDEMPFDIPGLIALIYADEDTTYTVSVAVWPDDQTLYEYSEALTTDLVIGPDLIIDPALAGASMTLVQNSTQTLQPTAFNQPVEIVSPLQPEAAPAGSTETGGTTEEAQG